MVPVRFTGSDFNVTEDAVRLPTRLALAAALVVTMFAPLGRPGSHPLAIGRDDDPREPVKIIRRLVVWIFDELGVPRP